LTGRSEHSPGEDISRGAVPKGLRGCEDADGGHGPGHGRVGAPFDWGFGFQVSALGLRVQGSGIASGGASTRMVVTVPAIAVSVHLVSGVGFRVEGSMCRVQGMRISGCKSRDKGYRSLSRP